jgi:thiol:disulfide interchange protein DsbD
MMIPRILLRIAALSACLAAASGTALAANNDEFLEPEIAFKHSARVVDANALEVNFRIVDGYYMYREKFRFAIEPAAIRLGTPEFPAGKVKVDEFFGRVETYRGNLTIRLPIQVAAGGGPISTVRLKTTYQGCADAGICYPPLDQFADLRLAAAISPGSGPAGGIGAILGTASTPASSSTPFAAGAPLLNVPPDKLAPIDLTGGRAPVRGARPETEQSRIVALLNSGDFWAIIFGFLGVGLLLAFTPCVFPMIPIISGIIAGEGHTITRSRSFLLSLAYVLGMAITYTAAGIAAGLSGTLLSAALQNVWVLTAFALVFVLLALSMFGFYELQLPSALQTKLADASNRIGGGKISGTFLMGALSVVIVGPCVAAPLAGALLYIGQTRDVMLGGSALFAMAIGMGVPLLLVGMSAGTLLPKAGAWMESVKRFFGVLLLGMAIWIVSPLLPAIAVMLMVSALLIVSAIYMSAIDPLPTHARGAHRFWKGVGVIALVAGVALLLGALSGGRDLLQPLSALRLAGAAPQAPVVQFERVKTVAELDARIASAKRPVMLDFYADWCVSCKEMERFTFSDPAVQAKFAGMLLLQADVTANDDADKALLRRFHLHGPPGIIFFDARGSEFADSHVIGFQSAESFLKTLDYVTGA